MIIPVQEGAVMLRVVQRPAAHGLQRGGAGGWQARRQRAHRAEERVQRCACAARRPPARTHRRRGRCGRGSVTRTLQYHNQVYTS